MKLSVNIEQIKSKYDKRILLSDINFSIESPGLVWIQGENGCGKSILSSILSGKAFLRKSDLIFKGEIYQSERNKNISAKTSPAEYIDNVSYLPQQLASSLLAIHFQDDFCFPFEGNFPKFKGNTYQEKDNRIIYELNQLNQNLDLFLHAKKKIGECSYGETRRIEFACSLAAHSKIVILDEPFSGLDPKWRGIVLKDIKNIATLDNSIVIITSHHCPDYYEVVPDKHIILPSHENVNVFSTIMNDISNTFSEDQKKNTEIINLNQFEISRKESKILSISDYSIFPGTVNWIEGHNGAGKTTLLLFLAGIIKRSKLKNIKIYGNIFGSIYHGWSLDAPNSKVRILLQNPYKSFLYNEIADDLKDIPDNVKDKISNNWGTLERNSCKFSFGQLKLLQLLLLPKETDVILLDEPLLGIHTNLYPIFIDVMDKIAKSGRYVLACSENNIIELNKYIKNINLLILN